MLMDLLNKAVTVAMLGFVVSSMLAMGSGLTIRQIIEPLRNPRLVLLALLANFVLMPLGALALAKVSTGRRSRHWTIDAEHSVTTGLRSVIARHSYQ